jgi:hypothetical protein
MLESFWFLAFVAWPAVTVVCALANMMVWWKFHWAEPFVLAPLAGIAIGAFWWWAIQAPPTDGAVEITRGIFATLSHGLFGILAVTDVIRDPQQLFWITAFSTLGATFVAAGLDHAAKAIGPTGTGAWALSILIFAIKAPFCLVLTAIGSLISLVGLIQAAASSTNKGGFSGGCLWEEWDRNNSNTYATTLGATFHVWQGKVDDCFEHELHHTRQCIYFRDLMVAFWAVGEFGHLATGTNDGNPLETVPYQIG